MSSQQASQVATKDASFMQSLQKMLRMNIRDYGMYIALFVIMAFFTWRTDGLFISSRNIANLLNQTGYIAVLAVGMTLVIVIRHIDLSVGFLSGFLAALAAIGMKSYGLPVYVVIPLAMALGILAGCHYRLLGGAVGNSSFRGNPGRVAGLPRTPAAWTCGDGHRHYCGQDIQRDRQWLYSRHLSCRYWHSYRESTN